MELNKRFVIIKKPQTRLGIKHKLASFSYTVDDSPAHS